MNLVNTKIAGTILLAISLGACAADNPTNPTALANPVATTRQIVSIPSVVENTTLARVCHGYDAETWPAATSRCISAEMAIFKADLNSTLTTSLEDASIERLLSDGCAVDEDGNALLTTHCSLAIDALLTEMNANP